MKKRNILILVIMLVIGFAAVSTTLVLNGTLNIGFNSSNFEADIIFTRAETHLGSAIISDTKKEITYNTERLENINQTSILEFDVTNKNRNYDADVTIKCDMNEEFGSFLEYVKITTDLESPFELLAGHTKTGHVIVEMIKAYDNVVDKEIKFECKLVATPKERDTLGDKYVIPYKDEVLNGADPVLKENLIPVTIANDGIVTYADISEEWYNYENKEWANAVILNNGVTHSEGDVIPEGDIESYFVWVPKYKYQIFDMGNYTSYIDSKPAESNAKEIQIEFSLDNTEDTDISCVSPRIAGESGTCEVGKWMTHPAFINFDVKGIWVGKFETGSDNGIVVKPNETSDRMSSVSTFFETSYNYERSLDSHMIKNTEWGATAYLSHSKYGINTEVRVNNTEDYLTGYAATDGTDQSSYPGTDGTDETTTLPYNTPTGYKASTTGNITGVYDMSGGADEYVAGYMPSSQDKLGFTSEELMTYSKYFDIYPSDSTKKSYNNRILGDATGELGLFYYYYEKDYSTQYHNNWYDDASHFVESTAPWFLRGGGFNCGRLAGQFHFTSIKNGPFYGVGSRLVLAPTI